MKLHTKLACVGIAVLMLMSIALTGCGNVKPAGQVVIGVVTEANGDWAYGAFSSSINATDSSVITLTDDYATVDSNKGGAYVINNTIVDKYDRSEDADGNATYTFTIKKDLVFNNGDPVKAENFLAWSLFTLSKVGADMGTVTAGYNMIPGGDKYRAGETNKLPGLRLLDEYTFSATVLAKGYDGNDYLPYYYDLGYAGYRAVNLTYWFGEGWHVKDDGDGAYLANDNGTEFSVESVGDHIVAAQYATSDRVTAGPYNLVSFDKASSQITLEVNENYAGNFEGQKPGIQKIVIVRAETDTAIDNLATGGFQIYSAITDGDQINAAFNLIDSGAIDSSYCQYDRAGFGYFGFACDLGPAQYVEFRQAIAHLLDRTEFAKTFCQGWGGVVHGPYCTPFQMYQDSEKLFAKELDTYAFDPDKAVELLEAAGFVYNADGSDYKPGSGLVRYKKVTAEEAQNYDQFCSKVGNDIYMSATLNWASSDGNAVSDLLSTMLANGDATKQAGVQILQNVMTFPELLNYMYRQDAYELGGDYSVPTYNMFNLASSWNSATYDYSFEFTTDPAYIADGYNTQHLYDDELDKLSMDMVYGVTSEEYDKYLDMWQKFVIRYNKLLPTVPLYSNIYISVYPNTIKNYEEGSFWGFDRAILYARYIGK